MSWEVRLREERQGTKIEGTKQERGLPGRDGALRGTGEHPRG